MCTSYLGQLYFFALYNMRSKLRQKGGLGEAITTAAATAASGIGLVGAVLILFLIAVSIMAVFRTGLLENPIPTVHPIPGSGVFFIAALILGICVLIIRYTTAASTEPASSNASQLFSTGVATGGAIAQRIGALPSFLLFGTLFGAAVYGVVKLVKACSGPSPLGPRGAPYYETFANEVSEYAKTLKGYIQQVEAATERIDTSNDHMMNATDDTCDIIRDIEDIYVSNRGSPQDEDETGLPEDMLKRKMDARKKRGKDRFVQERGAFTKTVSSQPMLECFQDAGSAADVADYENELESELSSVTDMLQKALDAAEVTLATTKSEQIHTALNFAEHQFNKNMKKIEGGEEGFADNELIGRVKDLLAREKAYSLQVAEVLDHAKKVKAIQKESAKKVNNLEEGNVDAASVDELLPRPKPTQGRCRDGMYQFAAYSGGFCCPVEPADYNKEHQDYSTCSAAGACALGKETAGGLPLCT